jgi:hypothetical protein
VPARRLLFPLAALASVAIAPPARADEAPAIIARDVAGVRVELRAPVDDDVLRVVGVVDGREVWTISHADVWALVPPVVVGDRYFYAVHRRGDVYELDVRAGVVRDKWRFPGYIQALELVDGEADPPVLAVACETSAWWGDNDAVARIRWRVGDEPAGRSHWAMLTAVRGISEGAGLAQALGFDRAASPDVVARAERGFAEAELRDPTNPFYPHYRARALDALGNGRAADEARMRAARTPHAPWSDLFQLSFRLERDGHGEAARVAFENGYARMLEARVRPERMQSLVALNVNLGRDSSLALRDAIGGRDVERAHVIAERTWRLMPRIELGHLAWRQLARWFDDQGRSDLASLWRDRAMNAESGWLNRISMGDDAARDFAMPLVFGLFLGMLGAAFVAGAKLGRGGASLRAVPATLATVAMPMFAMLLVAASPGVWQARDMWTSGAIHDDDAASPSKVMGLERLPSSPARDELLAYARAELAAAEAGSWHDATPPDDATIVAGLTPASTWWTRFRKADENFAGLLPTPFSYIDSAPEFVLVLLVPLLLGFALARWWALGARWVRRVLPGGADGFSIFAGVACGLFIAAILALFVGYDSSWDSPDSGARFFGMDSIWPMRRVVASAWWLLPLVAILLLQTWLEWRAARKKSRS